MSRAPGPSWSSCSLSLSYFWLTRNDPGLDRQFHARLPKRSAREGIRDTIKLKEYAPRPYLKNIVLRIALTTTHAHLCRLGSNGAVREDAYPKLARLRRRAGEHLACRFYLVARDTRSGHRLQPIGAEGNRRTAGLWARETVRTLPSGLPFAMFYFLGEQHSKIYAESAACRESTGWRSAR